MIINGIDLDDLVPDIKELVIPPVVAGRVAHIDADFLAYQTSAVGAGSEKTFDDMKHNAGVAIQTLKDMAGAEHIHLHTTPSGSTKGGRYELALLKEYQGNRKDKEKPQFLNLMRQHLTTSYPGTAHQFAEADDGMASSQYRSISEGKSDLSIIASKDKDLCMVPGLHLDWGTGEIIDVISPFGKTELIQRISRSGVKTNKLVGYGWSFFWAQMLTGDTADNISGLPAVHRDIMHKIKPTAQAAKAQAVLDDKGSSPAKKDVANRYLDGLPNKPCGPVLAAELLTRATTNARAFGLVKGLYQALDGTFKNYRDGSNVTWQQAMISEMQLLWMRRDPTNEKDVLNWLKEQTQ